MRLTLTKQQALVAKGADSKHERPELRVVRIGNGCIVASDGYGMVRAPVDYSGEPVCVPAHMMPNGPCDIDLDGESLSVVTTDGIQETTHETVKYPDADRAWAKVTKRKPKACIALNVALLRKMLRCIEAKDGWQDSDGIVRLYIRRPSDAIEWRIGHVDEQPLVEGLIMPMFVDWGEK